MQIFQVGRRLYRGMINAFVEENVVEENSQENVDVIQVWDDKCPEEGDMKWECNENEKGKEKIRDKWWKDLGKTEWANILIY